MKKIISSIISITLALGLSAQASASTPVELTVPIQKIYVPHGFDANDNVEVIISGVLPNLCHRTPHTKVTQRDNRMHVRLTSYYYEDNDPFCPKVKVPFLKSVELGMLDKGIYDIVVNKGVLSQESSKVQIIEPSTSQVDNHIYAGVSHIEFDRDNPRHITLKGQNPSECFQLKDIKFSANKDNDTLAVMPVLEQTTEHCPFKMIDFEYEFEVPAGIETDALLHVRSMDGRSVNALLRD